MRDGPEAELTVTENAGTFRVVAHSFEQGKQSTVWPICFRTKAAAELFRHDMILAAVDGIDNEASLGGSEAVHSFYEVAATMLGILEENEAGDCCLAIRIAREARDFWSPLERDVNPESGS